MEVEIRIILTLWNGWTTQIPFRIEALEVLMWWITKAAKHKGIWFNYGSTHDCVINVFRNYLKSTSAIYLKMADWGKKRRSTKIRVLEKEMSLFSKIKSIFHFFCNGLVGFVIPLKFYVYFSTKDLFPSKFNEESENHGAATWK